MIIEFRHNTNTGIHVNPSRTTRSIHPQINSLKSGTGIGFGRNICDRIPERQIGIFVLFDREMSDFSNSSASWHGTEKIEIENPGDNSIFENAEREVFNKVEKLGKKYIILKHIDSNHINANSNHSNHVNSNQSDSNNDSTNVYALNQLLSRDGDLEDVSASTVSARTLLDYVP